MLDNRPLKIVIDWDIDEMTFCRQIDRMIWQCQAEQKVIALPIIIQQGEAFAGQVSLLLSMVNCDRCDAACCYQELSTKEHGCGIGLIASEAKLFKQKGYGNLIKTEPDGGRYVDYPCPFYAKESPGRNCRIYKDRPFSCLMFPFQPGGYVGEERYPAMAVNSSCPEGIRLAKLIYLNTYRVKDKVLEVQKTGL